MFMCVHRVSTRGNSSKNSTKLIKNFKMALIDFFFNYFAYKNGTAYKKI